MHNHLQKLLDVHGGVLSRSDALAQVSRHTLGTALRNGQLTPVLPGIYLERITDAGLLGAATRYAGPEGALSHTSALWLWGLLAALEKPLHITVPADRQPRGSSFIRAHRQATPPEIRMRHGHSSVRLEQAVLESAPFLSRDARRAVAIAAVRERYTTADRLAAELTRLPNLRGRAEMRTLIALLEVGCQSELELFGYARIFNHPSFSDLAAQYPVRLSNRTIYLDLADTELRVAIELDGAMFHDGPITRERDRRRDVELAALGWVVLRFSARRLREDPDGVRREVLAVLDARRTQLRAA
jgi:hypothetical protein